MTERRESQAQKAAKKAAAAGAAVEVDPKASDNEGADLPELAADSDT